ncbi:hypothetical protein M3212_05365 [Alkalihalobacillus oceani]|uniref:hypothetical protein n=1 Tax=Halalkalibacter oceani TaxID=1653776 RepID=UPI00203D5C44|nr:hypothetical protein [Halalkalibacter oceani]MCM3760216.1 hypothetical protein [Halalkalibacter oceani]
MNLFGSRKRNNKLKRWLNNHQVDVLIEIEDESMQDKLAMIQLTGGFKSDKTSKAVNRAA